MTMYPTFVVNRTLFCNMDIQLMAVPIMVNKWHVMLFLEFIQPPKSPSTKLSKITFFLLKHKATLEVPFLYHSNHLTPFQLSLSRFNISMLTIHTA